MSVKKTSTSSRPPHSPRLRLSAHANIVLRGRYLAKNATGTIVETPGWFRISLTASDQMVERGIPLFAAAMQEAKAAIAKRDADQ